MRRIGFYWPGLPALLLCAGVGLADGFMAPKEVGRSTKMVASPKQQALLATDGKTVQVVLRAHFRSGPEELAWVVSVPSKPSAVEQCDDRIFQLLEEDCAPRFYRFSGKGGWGCHCGGASVRGTAAAPEAVVVEAAGTAGIFQYVVLSATAADELTRWLNQHKYRVPSGAERLFERYVKDGWHWLAMRVRPEVSNKPTLAPHPIVYTYEDTRLVYPLVISRLSADVTNEIVLYVMGKTRYACNNWENTTIQELTDSGRELRRDARSPSGTNYEKLFSGATELADGRLFVAEFVDRNYRVHWPDAFNGEIEGPSAPKLSQSLQDRHTLTRLRAVMRPEAMDRDVVLVAVPGANVRNRLYLSADGEADGIPGSLAVAVAARAAVCMGSRLMRQPGWARVTGVASVFTGCAEFFT